MGDGLVEVAYLRRVLSALERATSTTARRELAKRVGTDHQRLLLGPLASSPDPKSRAASTPASGAPRSISLDEAERFLLAIDDALGHGSGLILQSIGKELGTQYLVNLRVAQRDAESSMRRLVSDLTSPLGDSQALLVQTAAGFELRIVATGRPRSALVLRHLGVGYVQAAFTFSLEATSTRLRIVAETTADRSSVTAHYRSSESQALHAVTPVPPSEKVPATSPPSSRPRARVSNGLGPTSQRVDEILKTSLSGSWPAISPRRNR